MTVEIPALSPAARRAVLVGTSVVTLGSTLASELATYLISMAFDLHADLPAYVVAGVIPLLLAGPGSFFQFKRLEQLRQAYRELDRVASTDYLTGCFNRPAFTTAVSAAVKVGRPGALLVIDADAFRSINDEFGHDKGDDALRAIASAIREQAGHTDLLGRMGGEEFAVYLSDATAHDAETIAEAIRESVENVAFSDASIRLSVSIGVATTSSPTTFFELFHIAEEQLASAKADGRNRVSITAAEAITGRLAAA